MDLAINHSEWGNPDWPKKINMLSTHFHMGDHNDDPPHPVPLFYFYLQLWNYCLPLEVGKAPKGCLLTSLEMKKRLSIEIKSYCFNFQKRLFRQIEEIYLDAWSTVFRK